MRYLKQFGIILLISFAGEILHGLVPLPIPASIYGIVLLFAALELKLLPVSAVKEARAVLIEIMPVMFIPAAVGLIDSWSVVKTALVPYVVITVVTTFVVMVVSGKVVQGMTGGEKRKEGRKR